MLEVHYRLIVTKSYGLLRSIFKDSIELRPFESIEMVGEVPKRCR